VTSTAKMRRFPATRPSAMQWSASESLLQVRLILIEPDGRLLVSTAQGQRLHCDWLEGPATSGIRLAPGDQLLVALPGDGRSAVGIGRIGRYREPKTELRVTLEAIEQLTLKCGESALDLRADGKVMIRGEDVLLRAKGQHRIKAGTVAIN
jgi:hypothetical protein